MEPPGRYVDRETGALVTERVARGALFSWLYGTGPGRMARPLLLHSRLLHRLVGLYADSSLSRRRIASFAREMGIDLSEAAAPLESYRTFNDFFARRLASGARTFTPDADALCSPGDGKLLVVPDLGERTLLRVKGVDAPVGALLGDPELAARYRGGSGGVLRLYLADYHRVHFPAGGIPGAPRAIAGRYYSVTPFPGNDVPFYVLNARTVTTLETERFGRLCMVDVGGFLIASVRSLFEPGKPVRRGDEKSLFAFGGSTVVLLAEPGRLSWDEDLVASSARGLETYVKLGTRIARRLT